MKLSTLKNSLMALAVFAMASVAYAQDTASVFIRNACDSLHSEIELVPAYIEETNWYGNPHTMAKDSSNVTRHETYETLSMNYSTSQTMQIPVSIKASCREMQGTTVGYAKWTTSQTWQNVTEDDYSTYIYDIHALKMNGHDSSNTYNILAYVSGLIPDDYSFTASNLLFSATFEFAFEWWFASVKYQYNKDATHIGIRFGSAASNDSLKAVNAAVKALTVPDTIKSVRLQVIKVVLGDSRKPLSSSSFEASSSSENSSSSFSPVSCSSEEASSSSSAAISSSSQKVSSSSADPVSCSSVESSSTAEQSSSSKEAESSSSGTSSSSEASSSASAESSSGTEASSSSDAESSSSDVVSSSSEGPTRLATMSAPEAAVHVVQVRSLDGSVVKNAGKLAPGVYYMKYSNGVWRKTAVMPR